MSIPSIIKNLYEGKHTLSGGPLSIYYPADAMPGEERYYVPRMSWDDIKFVFGETWGHTKAPYIVYIEAIKAFEVAIKKRIGERPLAEAMGCCDDINGLALGGNNLVNIMAYTGPANLYYFLFHYLITGEKEVVGMNGRFDWPDSQGWKDWDAFEVSHALFFLAEYKPELKANCGERYQEVVDRILHVHAKLEKGLRAYLFGLATPEAHSIAYAVGVLKAE